MTKVELTNLQCMLRPKAVSFCIHIPPILVQIYSYPYKCLCTLQNFYFNETKRLKLVPDNVPVYTESSIKTWLAKVSAEVLEWAAQSPDLKPNLGMNWKAVCAPDLLI